MIAKRPWSIPVVVVLGRERAAKNAARRGAERARASAGRAVRALVAPLLVGLVLLGAARAEDVVAVRFPEGTRDACSDPVTGSFTVRGPGIVTTVITLVPYKSLGFVPNIPVGFRALGSDNLFTWHEHLPGSVAGGAYQLGRKVEDFGDGAPIEFVGVYELPDEHEYAIEGQAVPQCRMLNQGIFWQEEQEARFSVQAAGAWLDVRPSPELPPPDDGGGAQAFPPGDVLTSRVWRLGRSDGTVLVAQLRLLLDGRIEGANHANESRWAVVGSELHVLDAAGAVSTRFVTFRREDGRWVISGPFLLWGDITHVLTAH